MNDHQPDQPDDRRHSTPEWYLQRGPEEQQSGAGTQDQPGLGRSGDDQLGYGQGGYGQSGVGPGYPQASQRPDYQQGYPQPGPGGPWGGGYPPAYPPAYPTGYPPTGGAPGPWSPQRADADRAAKNAMILGVLGIVFGSLGIIFGPIALSKAAKAERLGGRAATGRVLGWIAIAVGVFWILGFSGLG